MEEKKIDINEMPKWFWGILLLSPLIGLILIKTNLDNDFYFLYTTGEHIVKHGFPHKDFLSMHSSMEIIVQQWFSTIIYYYIYKLFGKIGVIMLMYLCYSVISYLSYRISLMITKNKFVSLGCTLVADIWVATMFIVTRPQLFTYIIMLLELYLMEKYVQEQKKVYLLFLPVLSLLLINMHSSMWIMFFVYAMPHFFNSLPIKLGKYRQKPCSDFKPLLVSGSVSFLVGFLNPYGMKAMFYIFSSFGVPEINEMINEMKPTSFENAAGKMLFFIIAVLAVIAIARKRKNEYASRFVLLFSGSLILALMNYKSHAYFYLFGMISFSYLLKKAKITVSVSEGKRTSKEKRKLVILSAALAVAVVAVVAVTFSEPAKNNDNKGAVDYKTLDKVIQMIPKDDSVILYGNFVCGQYLEFKGYHPYIDGRAELFLKANNKEYNYYKEYYNLTKGKMNCKKFVEKYEFNYLVVEKDRDPSLYNYLINDENYTWKYKSKTVNLFIK